jgi:hypothetical protein
VNVTRADRHRLEAIVSDRSGPTSFGPLPKAAALLRSCTALALEAYGVEMAGAIRGGDARLQMSRHHHDVRNPQHPRQPIGRNMRRHPHQAFIRFLNTVEEQTPVGKVIHAIVDNYATHRHPKVRQRLARHPSWTFNFTPTSASWLHAVEGFYTKQTCVTSS